MKYFFLLIIVFYTFFTNGYTQVWKYKNEKDQITIPFELVNHVIIVPVYLNGLKLSFILDTGVKETLLFGNVDSLTLKNTSSVRFQGLGVDNGVDGLLSLQNTIYVGDSTIVDHNHNLYVIVDSTINLSKNLGVPIHGIIGGSIFQNNIVRIDYLKKKLRLMRNLEHDEKWLRKFVRVPLELINDRPYVQVDIENKKEHKGNKMLLDLGNSDPGLIFQDRIPSYKINERNVYEFIGQGFNGDVYGIRARVKKIKLNNFEIIEPFVSHPDKKSYNESKLVKDRVGSIGNQIISRFEIVISYQDSVMYMKKNRNFKKPYQIDMSGLDIIHEGFNWLRTRVNVPISQKDNRSSHVSEGVTINLSGEVDYLIELLPSYKIHQIRKDSPAMLSGLAVGDRIHRINGKLASKMSLQQLKNRLQTKDAYEIKMEVYRDGKLMKFYFALEDPIALK